MKTIALTKETQSVLKNFCTINSSILVREGSTLKTISVGENMIAKYDCSEKFPQTFGIYDLSQFLLGSELFGPDLKLNFEDEKYVTLSGSGKRCKYFFSDPEITIKSAPERDVKFPGGDLSFTMTIDSLRSLSKASSIYNLPDLKFSSKDNVITMELCDRENDTTNVYSEVMEGETTGDFDGLYIKVDNLRLHSYSGEMNAVDPTGPLYDVKISSKLISEWKHRNVPLTYYIALEP